MNRLQEIKIEIEKLKTQREEFDKIWDYTKPFFEYENAIEPITSRIEKLDREKRIIMEPEFEKKSEFGTLMSLKEFIECCNSGGFIDYDGYGYYVKDNQKSNIIIYPSDVSHNSIRKDFDQIIWFNR